MRPAPWSPRNLRPNSVQSNSVARAFTAMWRSKDSAVVSMMPPSRDSVWTITSAVSGPTARSAAASTRAAAAAIPRRRLTPVTSTAGTGDEPKLNSLSAPLVSVLLPVRDEAPYLAEALASISEQTLEDFETIVVDDGSTDESAEIAVAH